jgi:predicted ATPase/DNA-binding SARP family transcriptional activator
VALARCNFVVGLFNRGVEFRVLGPLEVVEDGRPLHLGTRKQRTLLALLLLKAGGVVPRDRLVEELWHGKPPRAAEATLRSYLSRLRSLVGQRLERRAMGYALAVEPGELDAIRFERQVAEGREALAQERPAEAAHRLAGALALWRGDPYADFLYEPFAQTEIARLAELRLEALEERVEAELLLGRHESLVAELERLVAEHPLRERLWCQLMLALYRCNRQAEALAAYRRARDVLTRELGLEPGEQLRRLQQAVLRQEVPAVSRAGGWHNLPVPLSSFVGRDREVEHVEHLLGEVRLVTVTGVGGVGKTRLALAAARRAVRRVERVCFVDLSAVRDGALVLYALAEGLGVPESGDRPLLDTLIGYLRRTELLLVLDNCEHVVEACAGLVERLLRSVPALRVLATSRERLGVPGEVDYALAPLPVPDSEPGPDELPGFASVRLFLDRASAARADFAATPDAVTTVAGICRDLDGIPLAIELAAARAKALSAGEIAAHLDRRFDFLKFWRQTAVARHQTLRATMDWSYDLLSAPEQEVLPRLSVFAGGFTVTSAARVCTDGDERDALDVLGRLVERSLVVAGPGSGETRYRLLETVRQYAAERLGELGEPREASRAHAAAFLRLAEEAFSPGSDGLALLAREQGNLRAALEWSFAAGDEAGPRLARALGRFWHARHHLAEGRAWLERALALHRSDDALRAELLWLLGGLLQEVGDLTEAEEALTAGLRIAGAAGDSGLAARIRIRRADVRVIRGVVSETQALDECAAAAATLEGARDVDGMAEALAVIGKIRFWLRDPSDQEALERAVTLAHESGNRAAELRALEWLALSFCDLRVSTDVAIERQEQLLVEAAGESRAEAGIRTALAWLYGLAGRFAEARDALAWSGTIFSADIAVTLEWAGSAAVAGSIELMAGDPAAAERALRPAYEALRSMGDVEYLPSVTHYLASSLYEQGRYDEAWQIVADALASIGTGHGIAGAATCGLVAAKVHARRGELNEAERLALEGRRQLGEFDAKYFGEALLAHGEVLELAGKLEEAAGVFGEALALYEDRHAVPLAEQARARLERLNASIAPAG